MNKGKRPRFGLRDILWTVLVVALLAGWWVDHARQQRDMSQLFDVLRRETPWLVETDLPDWLTNQMQMEAKAKRELLQEADKRN